MAAGTGPTPSSGNKLAREFRRLALVGAILVLVFGGIQLWQIALVPHTTEIAITGENDPTFPGESTAQWLLNQLQSELALVGGNAPDLVLPAGTSQGTLRVRGRASRQLVEDGRVEAILRYPNTEDAVFEIRPRQGGSQEGALTFTFSLAEADGYLSRSLRTFVAVRNQLDNPVRGLRSASGLPCTERTDQPGVYDIAIPMESFLWVRSHDDVYLLEITDDSGRPLAPLEIPGDWFLHKEHQSRVLSLRQPEVARSLPEPTPDPTPPAADPEPIKTAPAPAKMDPPKQADPPTPDPAAERRAQIAEIERAVMARLSEQNWDAAEGQLETLTALEGPLDEVDRWRERIAAGRAEERQREQVLQLATEIGAAIGVGDWDLAEEKKNALAAIAPNDARLTEWEDVILQGREVEFAKAQIEKQAAQPPPEPPVEDTPQPNEEELVRHTLDRYVRSQNERNVEMYVAVFPSVSGSRRSRLEKAWRDALSQSLTMDVESIQIFGDTAVVDYRQVLTMQPKVGSTQTNEGRFQMRLAKQASSWIIEDIKLNN